MHIQTPELFDFYNEQASNVKNYLMDYLHGSHFHQLHHAPRYQPFIDAHSSL
jgi:hypothetical protein